MLSYIRVEAKLFARTDQEILDMFSQSLDDPPFDIAVIDLRATDVQRRYDFPGDFRELSNVLKSAVLLSGE